MGDEEYVCTLSDKSLEVARKELNEDPNERLGQVEAFRDWIQQQKHFTCPTDTAYLLKYLRTAKFSQLRARKIIEGQQRVKAENPEWLHNLDTLDPKIVAFYKTGYLLPLPKRDPKGRLIVLTDMGRFDHDPKKWTRQDVFRAVWVFSYWFGLKEDEQVNGVTFFEDMSHLTMKAMTFWGMDASNKSMKVWQGNFPGRFKELHYYNAGPVFDTLMAGMKPFMSKKLQDRMVLHGKNMEHVYKSIPMECWPKEYLPDDYTGPNNGSFDKILDDFIEELTSPAVRNRILYETSDQWKYDLSQKEDVPSASFRKLNVE